MKHVSVNFIAPAGPGQPPGYARLLRSTWLTENAAHLERLWPDAKARLCVVLVGDAGALPGELVERWRERYEVVFAAGLYEAIAAQFPNLCQRFGGPYSVFSFGFLRWLLVEQLFGGEPVLCYDGDVVHNASLDDLAEAFRGLTRTATSTAFAAVSDRRWFAAWGENLARLERDAEAFLEPHLPRLRGGREHFRRSPEEYFAKFLIEAGELPNDELPEDFPYWLAPQPQHLPRLNNFVQTRTHTKIPTPMAYSRKAGVDLLNGRPLAFWHMQKPFMSQLSSLAIFRESAAERDPGKIYPFNYYGRPPQESDRVFSDSLQDPAEFLSVPDELLGLAQGLIQQERDNAGSGMPDAQNPFHPAFLYDHYFRRFDFSLLFNNARWPVADRWAAEAERTC